MRVIKLDLVTALAESRYLLLLMIRKQEKLYELSIWYSYVFNYLTEEKPKQNKKKTYRF